MPDDRPTRQPLMPVDIMPLGMLPLPFVNNGSSKLRSVVEASDLSAWRIGENLGAPEGAVYRWLDGSRRPGRKFAALLQERFGIPLSAWDEPPPQCEADSK